MGNKPLSTLSLIGLLFLPLTAQVPNPVCNPIPAGRILDFPENIQLACFKEWLARGMPASEGSAPTTLIRGRSGLVLPILEHRIEEVLASQSPLDYFSDKTVDPNKFVNFAAVVMAGADNEEALRQIAKLMEIDEKRFSRDRPVQMVLFGALGLGNPYLLAYRGFEIGSPAIDKGIVAWAEQLLGAEMERSSGPSGPLYEGRRSDRWRWAEAMVERYGGPPTEQQWEADPLVSRLKPELATALHESMSRYAREAAEGRAPK